MSKMAAGSKDRRSIFRLEFWAVLASAVIMLFVIAEVALRVFGAADFPLYQRDPLLGYIPAPNQQGAFLNRNRWVFNNASFGVAHPWNPAPEDILLVGDSIVMGVNTVDQSDRIGPQLERATGCRVWPLGAGSWSLATELRALRSRPSLRVPQTLVVISNSEDLHAASEWLSEYYQPTRRPISLIAHIVGKRLKLGKYGVVTASNEWKVQLPKMLADRRGSVLWVYYPIEREINRPVRAFSEIDKVLPDKVLRTRIDSDRRWSVKNYIDHQHPNAAGGKLVADAISRSVRHCAAKSANS